MRKTILKAAPKAKELISYQMPAYEYNGKLVYFAGYEKHIGFYPTASGITQFTSDIRHYKSSKGAIQFPLDQELPVALITRIVQFRVRENETKFYSKAKPKTCVNGHNYTPTPTMKNCPICAQKTTSKTNPFATLPAPARRALQSKGITTTKKLSALTEKEISALHGIGPSSIPKLKTIMASEGMQFKSH